MLNHITLQGRLTKDPELRYTRSNTPVTSFTVAVERDFGEKDGVRPVDFIDCVAWKSRGEFVSKYFHKGDMICVSGRLELRDWTDQNGSKHRSAEVNVANTYFCGTKKTNDHPIDSTMSYFEEYDGGDPDDPNFPF